jgi:hypothetical protein
MLFLPPQTGRTSADEVRPVIPPHQFDELPIAALPEAAAELVPGECCTPIDPLPVLEALRCPSVAD